MERLIKDLNLIINHANWEDLKRQQTQATERFRKESREVDKENNNNPVDYNDKTVHELTTRERILQIKDVKENMKPPLTNLIRTHNPTSYLIMHPQTGTPLGKLDVIGRQLKEAVRMEIASKPLRSDGSTIELMVKAWAYIHNFLTRDARTRKTPAEVHLGSWRAKNKVRVMFTIKKHSQAGEETALGNLKTMLELAYERKKMLDNVNTAANNERRKQLRDHSTLLEEADIAEKFPVGGLVMLKSDNNHSRIDPRPPKYSPFYTMAHSHGNQIIMANLLTGQIKKRSYRNLLSVLASPELLSTTGLPQWLSSHPASQVGKEGRTTQVTSDKAIEEHRALVKNLADIYTFLSPILPTVEETTCKIECYRVEPTEETDQEQQLKEELEEDQEPEEQTKE